VGRAQAPADGRRQEAMKPIVYDLYSGLHGWLEGFLAEGYRCVAFDIEDMRLSLGQPRDPDIEFRQRDVRSIHGSELKDAAVIVASPPCQKYSYMAMPWKRAKDIAHALRNDQVDLFPAKYDGPYTVEHLNLLFNECFRIQREASEAAGHYIPLIVENVRGAQPWVGRARWACGSWYLWGDVPALMPIVRGKEGQKGFSHNGIRHPDWPHNGVGGSKAAKIPMFLARHIAKCFKPTLSLALKTANSTSESQAAR
jgi:hypothetical protein